MPLFSVIIPTYNHCDTIIWAVKSVQAQTLQDFEIIVAGDGAPDRTREIMTDICAADSRVRFLDNPKGKNKGEAHRHSAILEASGKYIAYLGDDDLWYKKHLEVLEYSLRWSHFCNTLHGCVHSDGKIQIFPGDIGNKFCRDTLRYHRYNFFGPTCVGHSREAYIDLQKGWSPAPKGMWSDLYMWRQWFKAEGLTFLTIPRLTTIHLDSPGRGNMSISERAQESKKWLAEIDKAGGIEHFENLGLKKMALEQGCYQFAMKHYQKKSKKIADHLAALEGKQ